MEETKNELVRKKRSTKFEKLERVAFVLTCLKNRMDRVEIARFLMQKYNIGRARAYRLIQIATEIAWKQFGSDEIKTIFLEHVSNLRQSIREASNSGNWGAVAQMQEHFADLLGFNLGSKKNETSPLQVHINQQQVTGVDNRSLEITIKPLVQELENLSKKELEERISRFITPNAEQAPDGAT